MQSGGVTTSFNVSGGHAVWGCDYIIYLMGMQSGDVTTTFIWWAYSDYNIYLVGMQSGDVTTSFIWWACSQGM